MIHRKIIFHREGLDDPDDETPDAMQGKACVQWVKGALEGFPHDSIIGPGKEDWGWYIGVKVGTDTHMLGCSSIEQGQWVIHVSDFYNRGVLPWTRRRKRIVLEQLADRVEGWIRDDQEASIIEVG